jgi:hypothetical protein
VKDIAASRIDNGPGSKFQAALLEELGLALNDRLDLVYTDDDLLNSFNSHLKPKAPTRATKRRNWLIGLEKRENARVVLHRLVFAILGGFSIVLPLLLMAVPMASRKMLIIFGVSILVFSLVVAVFSSATPEHLLTVTAAYAAVLVVFLKE